MMSKKASLQNAKVYIHASTFSNKKMLEGCSSRCWLKPDINRPMALSDLVNDIDVVPFYPVENSCESKTSTFCWTKMSLTTRAKCDLVLSL